jgi:hypothetical protein
MALDSEAVIPQVFTCIWTAGSRVQERAMRLVSRWKVGAVVLLVACTAFLLYFSLTERQLSGLGGRLYAADETTPANPCGESITDTEFVVLLGANAVKTSSFPLTILNVDGQDRLVLERGDDGSIAVTVDIVSDDGSVIIRMTKGNFTIVPRDHRPMDRKDRNSLQVTDPSLTQMLTIRYVNRHTLWIDAVLRYPSLETPVIFSGSDSGKPTIRTTEFAITRNCYHNMGLALLPG